MSKHNATHVLFRAAAPNGIASQQLRKLPESFLRGGLACNSVPVQLELAEAAKRQAHYLLGYLRGPWVWVKMALIKMEWTCLGSCETLSGVGFGAGMRCVRLISCALLLKFLSQILFFDLCLDASVSTCASVHVGCVGNAFWLRPVLMWGEPGAGHITTPLPPFC